MGLVAAVGAAVTAVATSVGVAVTATALTVGFEAIAAVGATLGVVGAVTHNKTLSYVGLGLGAVGGVGALASSAGLLGAGASPFASGGATDAAAGAATTAQAAAGPTADVASTAGTAGSDVVQSLASPSLDPVTGAGSTLGDITTGAAPAAPGGFDGGILNNPDGITMATDSAGGTTASTDAVSATAAQPTATSQVPVPSSITQGANASFPGPTGTDVQVGAGMSPATPGATPNDTMIGGGTQGATDAFDKIVKYAGDHPVVGLGALQAGGSLLSGLTSSLTPAQVNQLNAQAAANQAAADLTKQQTANLAGPKPIASLAPVTGTPTPIVPGLMNSTPAVTGVPAVAA